MNSLNTILKGAWVQGKILVRPCSNHIYKEFIEFSKSKFKIYNIEVFFLSYIRLLSNHNTLAGRKRSLKIFFTVLLILPLQAMDIISSQPPLSKTTLTEKLNTLVRSPKSTTESVEKIITAGADIHSKDDEGIVPLAWSVRNNRIDLAMLLLKNGAYVDGEYYGLCSVLSSFAQRVVKFIRRKKDNSPNYRYTPLIEATHKGLADLSMLLIQKGANPNVHHEEMGTPLENSLNNKMLDVIMLLVKHGADVNIALKDDTSPLIWAWNNKIQNIFELILINGANLNENLCLAAEFGNLDLCALLLEKGAHVDGNKDKPRSNTPLARAAHKDHKDICLLLINKGANVNAGDPFQRAAYSGHEDVCILLVNKGAQYSPNVFFRDDPLESIFSNMTELFKLLIEKGDSTFLDESLQWAAFHGSLEICKIMLERGANINGDPITSPLRYALLFGHINICTMLINRGADLNLASDESPLAYAIFDMKNNPKLEEIVLLLIEKGADLNGKFDGETSLMYACENGFTKLAEILIRKGADIYPKSGRTALQKARSVQLVKTIVIYGFLQSMARSVPDARNRIKTFLLCLKRCNTSLPKDVVFEVLKKLPEDVVGICAENILNNRPIPHHFIPLALTMDTYTPEVFIEYLKKAEKYAKTEEVKSLIDRNLLKQTLNLKDLIKTI